jgi:hypothetical protein
MEQSTPGADEALGQDQSEQAAGVLGRYGRRALVFGAAATGAGAVAGLVAGAQPAEASPQYVVLGNDDATTNSTGTATEIVNGSLGSENGSGAQGLAIYGVAGDGPSGIMNTLRWDSYKYSLGAGVGGDTNGQNGGGGAGPSVGVIGVSSAGPGMLGVSYATSGLYTVPGNGGVVGDSTTSPGIAGYSRSAQGILGTAGGALACVEGTDGGSGTGAGVFGLLTNTSNPSPAVSGQTAGSGPAVHGTDGGSGTGSGVSGVIANLANTSAAVSGQTAGGGFGVLGTVNGASAGATENGAGVAGYCNGGIGILGSDAGSGVGVYGLSDSGTAIEGESTSGIGVFAGSGSGTALKVAGVATFTRSGVVKVLGTSTKSAISVEVKGVSLTASSLILATAQTYVAGVGVAAVVPDITNGSFIIHLTEAVSISVKVGWFVVG